MARWTEISAGGELFVGPKGHCGSSCIRVNRRCPEEQSGPILPFFFFFFFTYFFSYIAPFGLSSSLLSSSFVIYFSSCTRKTKFLSKALVYHCFLVFRRIGEYISRDVFCFVLALFCSCWWERTAPKAQSWGDATIVTELQSECGRGF